MRGILNLRLYRLAGLFPVAWLLLSCATSQLQYTPSVQRYEGSGIPCSGDVGSGDHELKVMTLNVAHGRGTGFHQMLQNTQQTVTNLDHINLLLTEVAPDIVALQEIDGPSFWSGKFNHVEYLASRSGFSHSVQALHVDAMGLAYGTALVSRLALSNSRAVTFDPSLSPVPKGFVVSTIRWPGWQGIDIDVVSVHLDFMSGSIRKTQADELVALLHARNNPVIVMGDLNSGWHQQESTAQYLVEQLGLTAYRPEDTTMMTFPALGERLDWILISSGIEFSSYEVLGTEVSDHRGIVARLTLPGRQVMGLNSSQIAH
jgi:endonuclease/exonuclease/phosphatase family metal-dependent hydrolase